MKNQVLDGSCLVHGMHSSNELNIQGSTMIVCLGIHTNLQSVYELNVQE